MGAAYTKAVVTVGVNALLTSGKDRGIIDAREMFMKRKNTSGPSRKKPYALNSIIFITMQITVNKTL